MARQMDDMFAPILTRRSMLDFDTFIPAADVHETKDKYIIETEMPGVKREDIKFELVDNTLVMKAEVKKAEHSGRRTGERYYGLLERAFTVPARIDPDTVQAELKDGVLKIEIGKKEGAEKPLQISWKE